MSEKQKLAARPKCRKIYETYKNHEFVLDDECYMTKSNSTLAGNDVFYTDDPKITPDNVKNKYQAKFEEKVLIYLAISPRGCTFQFKKGIFIIIINNLCFLLLVFFTL
jgi:hypothetical protein